MMKRVVSWFFIIYPYLSFADVQQAHYKMYCMYTPQFEKLYEEYFLPSLKDDFELVVSTYPQECSSGLFREAGWEKTMLRKLEMLLEAIEENGNGQIFFYSDIDIIFLKPILEVSLNCLGDNDFVVQQGWPRKGLCAGFFVMRGNQRTHKLIMTAHKLLNEKVCIDDQEAIQAALNEFNEGIAWDFLPAEQFPNGRRVLKQETGHYSSDSEIAIDDSILLFHANCCIGLDNKYHFLKRVQEEYFNKH